jgi:DNA-binding transcriptional MerR regulator
VRTWYTTREVRAALGNLSQQRISQLVRGGLLVAERDPEGRLQYDRETVDRLSRDRAARAARTADDADERAALVEEARDRFRRERRERVIAERARIEYLDSLRERSVVALEGSWCLLQGQR